MNYDKIQTKLIKKQNKQLKKELSRKLKKDLSEEKEGGILLAIALIIISLLLFPVVLDSLSGAYK